MIADPEAGDYFWYFGELLQMMSGETLTGVGRNRMKFTGEDEQFDLANLNSSTLLNCQCCVDQLTTFR